MPDVLQIKFEADDREPSAGHLFADGVEAEADIGVIVRERFCRDFRVFLGVCRDAGFGLAARVGRERLRAAEHCAG